MHAPFAQRRSTSFRTSSSISFSVTSAKTVLARHKRTASFHARKYHGLRESEAHKKIKALIEASLVADPQFSEVKSERQWRSKRDPKSRRQPDVQASSPIGQIAFEAQLSTTFLDVVVERRSFYRDEGALLIWVMGRFDPDYRRMTTDDLLFSNNSNIFVVDDETRQISEDQSRLHLRCHYRVPDRSGESLTDRWESRIVPFDDLTCDLESQRAWYFDYEGKAAAIRAEIENDVRERKRADDEALREGFIKFWSERVPHYEAADHERAQWLALREELGEREIDIPSSPDDDSSLVALLNGIISAKAGHPVGWNFKKLIEVGHRIADAYPQHIAAYGFAIREYGQSELLDDQDGSGKWKRRTRTIRAALRAGNDEYRPDARTLPLIMFLFPSIGAKLKMLTEHSPGG